MSDGIHELGRNAHHEAVSAGRYVVRADGHVILLPAHVELKPGQRLATAEDLENSIMLERARRGIERAQAQADHDAARDRDHAAGELERADTALQEQRFLEKLEKRNVDRRVIAAGDVDDEFDASEADDFDSELPTASRDAGDAPDVAAPSSSSSASESSAPIGEDAPAAAPASPEENHQ